jgi:hypothetical protein
MLPRIVLASSMVLLSVAGCSSSGGGGSGGEGPICSAGTFQLNGTIGTSSEGVGSSASPYEFVNSLGGHPGTLNVGFGGQATCADAGLGGCTAGSLHLTWNSLVADDQSVAATGTLVLPDQSGQTYCIDGATLTPRNSNEGGGGVSFVLTSFGTGSCPGTSVTGSMSGCASP